MGINVGGSDSSSTDMLSGFTQLGTKIHEDSLESMSYFTDMMNQEWAKRQKEKEMAEEKRQFNLSLKEKRRGNNLAMIEALRSQREKAERESKLRNFYKMFATG